MKHIGMAAVIVAAGLVLLFVNMPSFTSPTDQFFLWTWFVCVLSLATIAAMRKISLAGLLFSAVATGAVLSAAVVTAVASDASMQTWFLTVPLIVGQVVTWWALRAAGTTREHESAAQSVL